MGLLPFMFTKKPSIKSALFTNDLVRVNYVWKIQRGCWIPFWDGLSFCCCCLTTEHDRNPSLSKWVRLHAAGLPRWISRGSGWASASFKLRQGRQGGSSHWTGRPRSWSPSCWLLTSSFLVLLALPSGSACWRASSGPTNWCQERTELTTSNSW